MVICAKKDGKSRRTVDFQPLNVHATRETHHTPSPFHQARPVPHGTKKLVLDAWNGYHSVPIQQDDRHLTTFKTPWGRYRYKTAPQGYIASGDGYTRRYDEIVAHIQNKIKCIDDVLLWANSLEDSFFRLHSGWIFADKMALPSTQNIFCSHKTLLTLLTLKFLQAVFVPAQSTSMPSWISQPLKTSPMYAHGLD